MAKTKAPSTLPDMKRFSLKRADVFALGRLIEEASEDVPGGRAYKLGQSDQSVAATCLERLKLPIEPEAIVKVRKQLFGAFVTDKGGVRGQLDSLRLEVAALRKQTIDQGKLLAALQLELRQTQAPQVRQPAERRLEQPSGYINGSRS